MNNAALRVATDLGSVAAEPGNDLPQDVLHGNAVYRLLDADYYAWLRRRMERAKKAHNAGKLPLATWKTLRERFNGIHEWAVARIGEQSLVQGLANLDEKSYQPPRHDRAIALVDRWDERAAIMEHDGGLDRTSAEQSATHYLSRELTPEDIASFKALGVEVHIRSRAGEFVLVPKYTGRADQQRVEISPDDLAKISQAMRAFPGSDVVYVGKPLDMPGAIGGALALAAMSAEPASEPQAQPEPQFQFKHTPQPTPQPAPQPRQAPLF